MKITVHERFYDEASSASSGITVREALKPLESMLSKTIDNFSRATDTRPNPEIIVGKYTRPCVRYGNIQSEPSEYNPPDNQAGFSVARVRSSDPKYVCALWKKEIHFGGELGDVYFHVEKNFSDLSISESSLMDSTLYGVQRDTLVDIRYTDPMTKKKVKLDRVPTIGDLADVKRVYSLSKRRNKKIVPYVYVYRSDCGVSETNYIFVVADTQDAADALMKNYVETHEDDLFSYMGRFEDVWRYARLDGVTLVDGILVYNGYYDTERLHYIDLRDGITDYDVGFNKPMVFFNKDHKNFPNGCEGYDRLDDSNPKRWHMQEHTLVPGRSKASMSTTHAL